MKKARLDYLDFAKCITIFLVIWGHTTPNGSTVPYRVALYAFHMPLFFLVSGMVISRHQHEYDKAHWKNFLFKNVMALLVPYLIWGAIYSNFTYRSFVKLFYGSWEMLNKAETLTSLWYLPCLFVARVLAELTLMLSRKIKSVQRHLFGFIISILFFALGFLLPRIEIGYPLCLNVAFAALGFIMLGYAIKNLVARLPKKNAWAYLAAAAAFGALFFLGQRMQGDSPYLVMMCKAQYGNIPVFLFNAFAGIGLVISFSLFLTVLFRNNPDNKARAFMLWTGENTIGIYFLHKPFLQEVVMPTLERMGATLPNAWWGLLGSVVAFIFSAAGCCLINRYVPSLFGRFRTVSASPAAEQKQ